MQIISFTNKAYTSNANHQVSEIYLSLECRSLCVVDATLSWEVLGLSWQRLAPQGLSGGIGLKKLTHSWQRLVPQGLSGGIGLKNLTHSEL